MITETLKRVFEDCCVRVNNLFIYKTTNFFSIGYNHICSLRNKKMFISATVSFSVKVFFSLACYFEKKTNVFSIDLYVALI